MSKKGKKSKGRSHKKNAKKIKGPRSGKNRKSQRLVVRQKCQKNQMSAIKLKCQKIKGLWSERFGNKLKVSSQRTTAKYQWSAVRERLGKN